MISVLDLCKEYGAIKALKGISFEVPKGQIVGFLGPNGAGKTTTMKTLTCFMPPTSGAISIDGIDAYADPLEVKKRIGYLPESTPLYVDMVVYDYLAYVAQMRDIPKSEQRERIFAIAKTCGISSFISREISTLSKGQRQRVGLAQALIHNPPILILDEPTSGLDPNQIVEIRQLIKELGKDRTIILSTHNLPEVMQTCDRIIIVHQGRIVADGTAEELEASGTQSPTVLMEVEGADAPTLKTQLEALEGVRSVSAQQTTGGRARAEIETGGEQDIRPALSKLASTKGWTLYELHRDVLDLEGIFRQLTQQA